MCERRTNKLTDGGWMDCMLESSRAQEQERNAKERTGLASRAVAGVALLGLLPQNRRQCWLLLLLRLRLRLLLLLLLLTRHSRPPSPPSPLSPFSAAALGFEVHSARGAAGPCHTAPGSSLQACRTDRSLAQPVPAASVWHTFIVAWPGLRLPQNSGSVPQNHTSPMLIRTRRRRVLSARLMMATAPGSLKSVLPMT